MAICGFEIVIETAGLDHQLREGRKADAYPDHRKRIQLCISLMIGGKRQ